MRQQLRTDRVGLDGPGVLSGVTVMSGFVVAAAFVLGILSPFYGSRYGFRL